MTADDYSRWGRYASAEVEAAAPSRSPWGADASADLDDDDAGAARPDGLWGEGESADEFEYADDVEDVVVDAADDAGDVGDDADGVEVADEADVEVAATEGFVSTGHEAVDAAVHAVENAARLPVGEQLAAYEAAHTTLREVLASIEE